MLVLTRKRGEALKFNDDVTVRILDVRNGQVKIGVEAPKDVMVHREEIYLRVQGSKDADSE